MLNIKKLLTKIIKNMDYTPIIRRWGDIATPTATWYTLATFNIPANSQYLILACNGNGKGNSATCVCNLTATSGSGAVVLQGGASPNNSGSGNQSIGWMYIKTGSNPYTIIARNYGYDTSVTNCNGVGVAIPLVGVIHNLFSRIFERGCAVC